MGIITAPPQLTPLKTSELYKIQMDFNKTADDEMGAVLMAWDLYAYIKELENSLKACIEIKGK